MPRAQIRPRPRNLSTPELEPAAAVTVLEALGIARDRATAEAVLLAVHDARADYSDEEAWTDQAPSYASLLASVTTLDAKARALGQHVARRSLHPKYETFLVAAGADLPALRTALATLHRAIAGVRRQRPSAKAWPQRDGRPPRLALKRTIARLMPIHRRYASPENAGTDDLVEFLHAALSGIKHPRKRADLLALVADIAPVAEKGTP